MNTVFRSSLNKFLPILGLKEAGLENEPKKLRNSLLDALGELNTGAFFQ